MLPIWVGNLGLNHIESKKLAAETLELKKQYDNHLVIFNQQSKVVKDFVMQYGRSLDIKSIVDKDDNTSLFRIDSKLIENFWFGFNYSYDDKQDREVRVTSEYSKVVEGNGIIFYSAPKTVVETKIVVYKLKEIEQEFNKGNFSRLFELVKSKDLAFTRSPGGEDGKKLNDARSLLSNMKNFKTVEKLEKFFFKPEIIDAAKQEKTSVSEVVEAVTKVSESLKSRNSEAETIYQMSSREIIKALESKELNCAAEDVDANNEAILRISGLEGDSTAPIEIASDSDFIFHKEHFDRQCELSGTLRVVKAEMYARYTKFSAKVNKECEAVATKERNDNYDKKLNSDSTAIVVQTNEQQQQSCESLKQGAEKFLHNLEYFYKYYTSDDKSIADALEQSEVYFSIDTEGNLNINGIAATATSTQQASAFMEFGELSDAIPDNAESVKLAISGGEYQEVASSGLFIKSGEVDQDMFGQANQEL